MVFVFLMLSFKPAFSLSSFIFIKRLLAFCHKETFCMFLFSETFKVLLIYNLILISGIQGNNSVFYRLHSIKNYYKTLVIFPVLHNISLHLIYFINSSLHLWHLICMLLPSFFSPLVTTSLFSRSQSLKHVWLCDPMDHSTPGFSVLHYLLGACSNSCLLSWWCYLTISSSSTLFSFPSIRVFSKWVSLSYQVPKVLELQHQSFQWIFKVGFL